MAGRDLDRRRNGFGWSSALTLLAASGVVLLGAAGTVAATAAPNGHAASTGPAITVNTSITKRLDQYPIASGDAVWFVAVLHLHGPPLAANANIHFTGQELTFVEPNGTTFVRFPYASQIDFSSTATGATTVWNSTAFEWATTVPSDFRGGQTFLSGYSFYPGADGLPARTTVTWSGVFSSSECGFQFNWKWGAAVYPQFAGNAAMPNYAGIDVKAVDHDKLTVYANHDRAGTPENFRAYSATGGTGQGSQQYTGSPSRTVHIKMGCAS